MITKKQKFTKWGSYESHGNLLINRKRPYRCYLPFALMPILLPAVHMFLEVKGLLRTEAKKKNWMDKGGLKKVSGFSVTFLNSMYGYIVNWHCLQS